MTRKRKRPTTNHREHAHIARPPALSRTSTNATTSSDSRQSSSTAPTFSFSSRSSTSVTAFTNYSATSSFSSQYDALRSGPDDGYCPPRDEPSLLVGSPEHSVAAVQSADEIEQSVTAVSTVSSPSGNTTVASSRRKASEHPRLYTGLPLLSSWSIRILHLSPALAYQAELHASLSVEKLDEPLEYEALSYTWGPPFDGHAVSDSYIDIAGHRLSIGNNLDCALRRLRHRDRPRHLWIDAVCIDQLHDRERGYQIEIMEHIYSRATQVLVWLGEDSPAKDGEYVFDFCHLIGRHGLRPSHKAVSVYQSHWPNFKTLSLVFARRNYFRRRWVIQEVCHARDVKVMCGARSASLSTFTACIQRLPASRRALEGVKELCVTIGHLRQALDSWRLGHLQNSEASTLSDFIWILQRFHNFDCLDGRDRLYALISLWKSEVPKASVISSGYFSDCRHLYTEFAGNMINAHLPDTHVLCHLLSIAADQACNALSCEENISLPTWVVDWQKDPAPRIGAADILGDVVLDGPLEMPYSRLSVRMRCYGEIVEADCHYRDWVLKTGQGVLMPSYHGPMPDEEYTAALGGLCPKIQAGDILCQPISTYRARNRHVADAAMVLRPTGKPSGAFRIVGRCPLDLWWHEALGEDRQTEAIPTNGLAVLIE